jgi:group I intron endonuclease
MIQSTTKLERVYVGSAIKLSRRLKEYIYLLNKNRHTSIKLQNHFNKYGEEDLVFIILERCEKENLIQREQYYIDVLDPWFNVSPVAGSTLGLKVSEEGRQNNRKAKLGLKHSQEHNNNKIAMAQIGENNSFFNKHHSEESNEKRREWNRLHPITKETREKQRLSLLKYYEQRKSA